MSSHNERGWRIAELEDENTQLREAANKFFDAADEFVDELGGFLSVYDDVDREINYYKAKAVLADALGRLKAEGDGG